MILVTGATGFVGNHVRAALLDRGDSVLVTVRSTSDRRNLEGLSVEIVEADLRDGPALARAVSGCSQVFHVAADYRLWARNSAELYETNVQGTRNLLSAAHDADVEKVVYTSTVGTMGFPGDGSLATEESPVSLSDMSGHYKRSKFLGEQVALEFASAGLPVVIVNPTTPVGERDFKPTPTSKIIVDFLEGRMPAYIDTGLNFVDVQDVATGHLLAAEYGRIGERYLLGGRKFVAEGDAGNVGEDRGKAGAESATSLPCRLRGLDCSRQDGAISPVASRECRWRVCAWPAPGCSLIVRKLGRSWGLTPCRSRSALERAVGWWRESSGTP